MFHKKRRCKPDKLPRAAAYDMTRAAGAKAPLRSREKSQQISSWGLVYQLIRSQRKTLGMEIRDGKVLVRAPYRCSSYEITQFLDSHQNWLNAHLNRAQKQQRRADAEGALTEAEIKELTNKAKRVIPERVAYYAPLVGVSYGRITIRHQKTRWGSCSSAGNLNFNCLLMLAPVEVLDSVVVHELCHRKEMNHSQRFYRELLRVYPDYFKWHKWLKNNGDVLMKRLNCGK